MALGLIFPYQLVSAIRESDDEKASMHQILSAASFSAMLLVIFL